MMDIFYSTVIVILLCLLVFLWKSSNQRDLPPGPPHLPLVGSLPFVGGGNICEIFDRFRKQYGDLFTIHYGSSPVVVVAGYDKIKYLLMEKGGLTADRPTSSFLSEHVQQRKGVSPKSGMAFKNHHTFLVKTLRHFSQGSDVTADSIDTETDHLIKQINSSKGMALDPLILIRHVVYNMLMQIITGNRVEYDDKTALDTLQKYEVVSEASLVGPLALHPWLRHIPGDPFGYYKIKYAVDEIVAELEKDIQEHKKNGYVDGKSDYLYAYLQQIEKADPSLGFTEEELAFGLFELNIGGTTTTTHYILWVMLFLIQYPEIQEKINQETARVMDASGKLPKYQERLQQMPYTSAFMDEALRYSDFVNTSNTHQATADIKIDEYVLPKGTSILPYLSSIQRDDTLWPNPATFDVNRFLDGAGAYVKRRELSLFGMGPRLCPGELVARMMTYTVIIKLIQNYQICPSTDGEVPGMDFNMGLVKVPKPFMLRFKARV